MFNGFNFDNNWVRSTSLAEFLAHVKLCEKSYGMSEADATEYYNSITGNNTTVQPTVANPSIKTLPNDTKTNAGTSAADGKSGNGAGKGNNTGE